MTEYSEDISGELWWCNSHQRRAAYLLGPTYHVCKPGQGGVMIPCVCVNLTGLVEIDDFETERVT